MAGLAPPFLSVAAGLVFIVRGLLGMKKPAFAGSGIILQFEI